MRYKTIATAPGEPEIKIPFTKEEEDQADREAKAYYEEMKATQYIRDRNGPDGYLPVGDQLDMLYHDMKEGTNTFIEHRDAIKSKFKKSK